MNEMLEVLMYLFERHMDKNCHIAMSEKLLINELQCVGFPDEAVHKALNWLNGLLELQEQANQSIKEDTALRIFSPDECLRLDETCRGFLLYLEQAGILNPIARELVINRLMALAFEAGKIALPQVKWVALMVLFNQPDTAAALACMERLVLNDSSYLH